MITAYTMTGAIPVVAVVMVAIHCLNSVVENKLISACFSQKYTE